MHNKKIIIHIYQGFAILFSVIALFMSILFFITFYGNLSSDISDWDAFGSYFSVVVGIINLVFFIIITIYVAKMQDMSTDKQLRQNMKMHLQDYKWKRLEELNNIANNLLSIAVVSINSESIKKVYFESCKISRSMDIFISSNTTLFQNIDFSYSVSSTNAFTDYVKSIKDNTTFSAENINELNNLMANMDQSLCSLIINIQNDLFDVNKQLRRK